MSTSRTLTDDVMDLFVSLLSNGKITKITRDKIGPHDDLLAYFPYVGPPDEDRSAERISAQHPSLSSGSRA